MMVLVEVTDFAGPDRVHRLVDLRERAHFDDGDKVVLAEDMEDLPDAGYLRGVLSLYTARSSPGIAVIIVTPMTILSPDYQSAGHYLDVSMCQPFSRSRIYDFSCRGA